MSLSKVKSQAKRPVAKKVAKKVYPVATMEQLYCQYMECEDFVASTERMVAYSDQLFETFDNLISLRKTAKRFESSAEGMSVLNELVGHEFGGSFEADDANQAAKTIWQRIGEFFQQCFVWIKNFFRRVLNFFSMAKSRLKKTLEFINNGEHVENFEFIGMANEMKSAVGKVLVGGDANTFFSGANENDLDIKVNNAMTLMKLQGNVQVSDANAKQVVTDMLESVGKWRGAKTSAVNALNTSKAAIETAQGSQDLPAARLAQKKAAAFVKLINKAAAINMRSVSSFLANCKFQKGSAAQKEQKNPPPALTNETK